jgi:hypothetical protein
MWLIARYDERYERLRGRCNWNSARAEEALLGVGMHRAHVTALIDQHGRQSDCVRALGDLKASARRDSCVDFACRFGDGILKPSG